MKRIRPSRTKIVATVGPASRSPEMVRTLIAAGVDVFRINTAHGSREEHQAVLREIRQAAAELKRPVGVLVDLAGPKIRLGQLLEDPTECRLGETFRLVRGEPRRADEFTSNYERLIDDLSRGDRVMLADGTVSLLVTDKDDASATCEVTAGGIVRSRQGVNLPGVGLTLAALTPADLDNARWAAESGVDFISLSFVRSPVEVRQLKEFLRSYHSTALVVAKIEKGEALACLDEIVAAADAVMVARGDLGVEIDIAQTPVAQKRIIATCQRLARPVIVATQMLDSMQNAPRPTRAEVSDVANAILDGADACMLSGETAIGKYPSETVQMMHEVMQATEATLSGPDFDSFPIAGYSDVHPITAAVVFGATHVATRLQAALIVISTRSGGTARVQAKFHPLTPVVGISESAKTLQQMNLFWGIQPLLDAPAGSGPELRDFIAAWGRSAGVLAQGDRVVYITGTDVIAGAHNAVVVQEIP